LKSKSSESSPEQAFQRALALLAARDYSSAALQRKLAGRGLDEADVQAAIERLVAEGWLNDRRYAEHFVESAMASGRFFGPRLRLEMRRRGISPELVGDVLTAAVEQRHEDDDIRMLVQRRYPAFSYDGADERTRRRIVSFLLRRGFGISAIMRVLKADARGEDIDDSGSY